jgi:hypothetical protein
MVNETSPFSVLVEQRLAVLGSNAFAAEQAAGLPQDAIRNIIRSQKKEGPSISRAKEICDAIGLEFYIGPKRELRGFAEGDGPSEMTKAEALRGGYLPIPWLDASTRKGSSPFAVAQSWLASNGLAPNHLRAIEPKDAHLAFPFEGKPVAIIDTVAAQRGSSHFWAYRDGTTISISRAAFDDQIVVLFSANDDGPIRIERRGASGAVQLLGKVVWIGGKVT